MNSRNKWLITYIAGAREILDSTGKSAWADTDDESNKSVDGLLFIIKEQQPLPERNIIIMPDLIEPTSLTTVISVNPRLTS